MGFARQFGQATAAMVSSHVGVQVEPYPLNPGRLWAIWRQKPQNNLTTKLAQDALRSLGLVNTVIVKNHVDAFRPRVGPDKLPQERNEQVDVLVWISGRDDLTGSDVESDR